MEDSKQKDPKDKLQWHLYFDCTINKKGKGIGAVLATPQGQLFPFARKMTFSCTNNEAEYEACILGLQVALEHDVRKLHVHGDAILVISQVNSDWKTKDPKLVPYHEYLLKLIEEFEETRFTFMNRVKNAYADALATLASRLSIPEDHVVDVSVTRVEQPAHCMSIKEADPVEELPWYHDIKVFLESGSLPPTHL